MKNKEGNYPPPHSTSLLATIQERRSVRAFLKKAVPPELLINVLEVARFAPSGVNTQPWHVAVVGKQHRNQITQAFLHAKENNIPENPDYHYYPSQWEEPYKTRRKQCGLALYQAIDIKKEEVEKRKRQWYRNYMFFDAPVALIFHIEAKLCKGSWIDMGMFLQNVMLSARSVGLETCPQAALAEYPDIIREALKLPSSQHIVCGMAMGFADWTHPINQYRTTREPLDRFTVWYE